MANIAKCITDLEKITKEEKERFKEESQIIQKEQSSRYERLLKVHQEHNARILSGTYQ